jgi:hypothetical protein
MVASSVRNSREFEKTAGNNVNERRTPLRRGPVRIDSFVVRGRPNAEH